MTRTEDSPKGLKTLYESLAFSGAITASVTHELNNILGTIEQVAGLLEDFAFTISRGDEITPDQLGDYAARITGQTDRGMALVKRLNTFAHSADHPAVECDLAEVTANFSALMRRLARLHKVELTETLPSPTITVRSNPFFLQQVLYLLLTDLLPLVKQNTAIALTLAARDRCAVFTLSGVLEKQPTRETDSAHLRWLVAQLQGKLEEEGDEKQRGFIFSVPINAC